MRSGGRGTLVAAADLDGTVTVWDGTAGRYLGTVDLPKAELEPQVWVADDGVTAATMRTADGPLYLIDLRTRAVRTVPLHLGLPSGSVPYGVFRWTHQGQVVLAAGTEQHPIATALIVDVRTGRVLHRVPVPGDPDEIAPNPAGTWLAEAGQDGLLRFISIADGQLLGPAQEAVDGLVYNVSVSPDGRFVVNGWRAGAGADLGHHHVPRGRPDAARAGRRRRRAGALHPGRLTGLGVHADGGRARPGRRTSTSRPAATCGTARRVGVPGRARGMVQRCLHMSWADR